MERQPFVGRLLTDDFQEFFHAVLGHSLAEAVLDFRENNVQFENAFAFGYKDVAQVSKEQRSVLWKRNCKEMKIIQLPSQLG